MSTGPFMEKFIIVSSDHGRTHKCNFSVFNRKFPVWANLVKKYQNCQFKLKCGNLNTQNGDVHFFCFWREFLFWANLVQKIKIVNLSWNLVSRLIRMCRVQCFIFFRLEIPFLDKYSPKSQNCQFKLKFRTTTNSNMPNSRESSLFLF